MNLDARPTIPEHVMARQVGTETVLLNLQTGVYFGLDGVGSAVWAGLQQGGSLRDICSDLAARYDAPATQIEGDVLRLAADLVRGGLVVLP